MRLHRAERAHPEDRDIVAVESFLERELNETVSQRLAAKLLGVSHTALARWIKRGDLPLIFDPRAGERFRSVPCSTCMSR